MDWKEGLGVVELVLWVVVEQLQKEHQHFKLKASKREGRLISFDNYITGSSQRKKSIM